LPFLPGKEHGMKRSASVPLTVADPSSGIERRLARGLVTPDRAT